VRTAITVATLAFACPFAAAAAIGVRDRDTVRRSFLDAADERSPSTPRRRRWWRPLLVTAASTTVGCAVGFVAGGVFGAAAAAIACVVAPSVRRRRREAAETAAIEDGLADAVSAIAAGIRAGRSMAGALEEAASTVPAPLGPRLAALVDRLALGVPVEGILAHHAPTVPGPDGRLVAAVLVLHQRSGGDVPAVLDRVGRTLRERRASAREVRSLTAQARLSGTILGFLPIGFFLFLSVTARADVERALTSTAGATAVAAGLAMQLAAFLWIRRLLRVDV
jgi:tight adherence protein B